MKHLLLNFLRKFMFLIALLALGTTTQAQIFSQYVETDSGTTPKGVEIVNNTTNTLDFSTNNLIIQKGSNGNSLNNDATVSSGTLAPGEVMVVGSSDIGSYLTNQGLNNVLYVEKPFTFNGNDALAIVYNGTTTDVFGNPGNDPGSAWEGNGVSTHDQNIALIENQFNTGNTTGFTDPSTRFTTISTTPTGTNGLDGFGIAPTLTSATGPTISNIQQTPAAGDVNPGETVTVTAEITSPNAPISAQLSYTVDTGSIIDVNMNQSGGNPNIYTADIPAQAELAEVNYSIYAVDNNLDDVTSSNYTYTVLSNEAANLLIAVQDFDGTTPNWNFSTSIAQFISNDGTDYFSVVQADTIPAMSSTNFSGNIFGERDLFSPDGTEPDNVFVDIEFATLNISEYTDVELSFDYQIVGYNASTDDAKYVLTLDGVDQPEVFIVDGGNDPQDAEGTITIPISTEVQQVKFTISVRNNGGDGYSGFDNIQLTGKTAFPTYVYDNGSWTPTNPSGNSNNTDAILVKNGTATLSGFVNIKDVQINSGATLDLNSYQLNMTGDLNNNGTFIADKATLNMAGTGQQFINGNGFEVKDLTVNSQPGTALNTAVSINKTLRLDNGDLQTNGNLTLLSYEYTLSGQTTYKSAQVAEIGTGTITGEVTAERFIPANRAFRFISSSVTTTTSINENWQEGVHNTGTNFPADNQNPNPGYGTHITGSTTGNNGLDATPSGNPSLFKLNNTTQSWYAVDNTLTNTIDAGEPFRLFVRGSRGVNVTDNQTTPIPTRLRVTGLLAQGPQSFSYPNLANEDFIFFGNPYHATVNMAQVIAASTNIDENYYYVWDPNMGTQGAYIAVDLSNGNPYDINGSSNSEANEYLQTQQAAIVRTNAAGTATLNFEESHKEANVFTEVFRNAESSAVAANNTDVALRAHLYTTADYNNNKLYSDAFALLFDDTFNPNVDRKDAKKLFNINENMGIEKQGEYFMVEKRNLPQDEEEIALFTNNYRDQNYTLLFSAENFGDLTPYLKDNFTEELTALEAGLTTYEFSIDQDQSASFSPDRFSLVFQEDGLGVEEETLSDFSVYPNPVVTNTFFIELPKSNTNKIDLSIHNLLGQEITTSSKRTDNQGLEVTLNGELQSGVYILSINTGDKVITKRIIKK
ncbi:T9SS type A sorting domain-containing protein [Haloflavibacter putidus]|uniref:T9SS type A sorting domain-containing protein n=1 Tax=Haloflavibacter putidus TaxID=2576776 RepID=A0A507ZNP2_9FLAO|nr:T9SS type A sorting domain-containing protein [Haloflavibacter putidus]TQD38909.1 T9SS type A sorting domain-containing protein [Haloflavibacter putidus]